MAFPGSIYAPPGVYTRTLFEDPTQGLSTSVRLPLLIGTGSEILVHDSLEIVRGSSTNVDQRLVQEDETGRAVVSISNAGAVTLGSYNGSINRLQVRHYPIVSGNGTGTTATDSASVNVTVNGEPVVVLAINGAKGILTLSVSPIATDEVRVTYYFKRTDTQITDVVSDQITPMAPVVYGAVGQNYVIVTGVNDALSFVVDSEDVVSVVVSASPPGGWTAAQVAAFINGAASGTSLVASTATDNFGQSVLMLTADRDITVGSGTANSTIGLTSGSSTARNKVFYTFQRPIVDGSNGGITTTDPADVTVIVNNVQVIPTAVDGQSGAVTLPFAPELGAVISVRYYFNSWQDTFDNLQDRGVTSITRCGLTPDRTDYTNETDFVLQDDKIVWGTAVIVSAGDYTSGGTYFDEIQVSANLIDNRQYLAACTSVVNTSVSPAVDTRKQFQLPLQPTTGNGRDTPLGSSTFAAVSNGRIDLPTDRPDLVYAYWGYSVEDALDRGRVEVTKVDSSTSTITLAQVVPVGATVYATFYYNNLVDQTYSVECVTAGASGVGTYAIADSSGTILLTPKFKSKSALLATVTVEFPSGSERTPDVRFEAPFSTSEFAGAVEEDVTVTFASQDATLAKYAIPSSGPYYVISGSSDILDINVDNTGATSVDLSDPTGNGTGFLATLVSEEVSYSADSGYTTFEVTSANNAVDMQVDGILVQAVVNSGPTQDVTNFVDAINRAASGEFSSSQASAVVGSITLNSSASDQDGYYVGWEIKVTSGIASGDKRIISAYNGTTKVATVSANFTLAPGAAATYYVYNPETRPQVKGVTRFLGGADLTNGFTDINFSYSGNVTAVTPISASVVAASYSSASALASAVQTAVNAGIIAAGFSDPASNTAELEIDVTVDSSGKIVLTLGGHPLDTDGGTLEVVSDAVPADDFSILAGFDISTAGSSQAKISNLAIARAFQFTGAVTGQNIYDRLILTNRLIPGQIKDGQAVLGQTQLKMLGGTGASLVGLSANEIGYAGIRGTVMEPTLYGEVGLSGGQDPVTGQPIVTFYAAGGTSTQNNVFRVTFEGVPVTVQFTDAAGVVIPSGGFADVPLGPIGTANTILNQIQAAFTAAGVTGTVLQEGAGIRFRGASSAAAASIVIGDGSANSDLGFSSGGSASRTSLPVQVLVSAIMACSPFTTDGLAKTVFDSTNASYLFVQSLGNAGAGTTSSVYFESSTALRPGVGLGVMDGYGNSGESALDGYFVVSSDPVNGSGTANTSVLNSGIGQDGTIGQTYRDLVTGLTFSILPRAGNVPYPAGGSITFSVRNNVFTDSNLPVNTVPGVELVVSNTSGITVGDSASVQTFEKGGNQPSVGDIYYVTYKYKKQDYSTALFTKQSTIEAAYGSTSPTNPLSLASYLAILNGAVLLALKQVQKDVDSTGSGTYDSASTNAFITAIDDVEGSVTGGIYPDTITPLKGDSSDLFQYLAKHCDIQSSIRYRAERTGICGFSAGTQPRDAGNIAQSIGRTRMRLVYPDIATLSLSRADGTTDSYLVDGTYVAAAWVGNRASPNIDVATPWTRGRIFGFDELARNLDAVQQNQVAVKGVTVLAQRQNIIEVRQGLTTDMTNTLTKTPTVITIADEVQRTARATLDKFIGTKFLAGVTTQIEGQLSAALKNLVDAQIIAAFTGVKARVSPDDPTVAEVEAYYQPVFPLLYIIVTFNLRSTL
jgi:hypothetical protein